MKFLVALLRNKSGIAITGISFCIALILHSRAFMVGYLLGIIVIISFDKKDFSKKAKLLFFAGVVIVTLLLSFLFKTDSSLGRILIYKISFIIVKENFTSGIGIGNFEHVYGYYQRNYFKAGNFSIKELLLADNTKYAFNDYLQFIIEIGLAGLALTIIAGVAHYYLIELAQKQYSIHPATLQIACAQVVAISAAAFFTHVFERPFFQCIILISLTVIILYAFNANNKRKLILFISTAFICIICWLHYGRYLIKYTYYKQLKEAKELFAAGYMIKATDSYNVLLPYLEDDLSFLQQYGQLLFLTGNYDKACKVFKNLTAKDNSNIAYQNLGDCYYKLGKLKKAEEAYLNSIYMVPNRFTTRYNLFNFYCETNQWNKAVPVGESILKLPVKIPSHQISLIKKTIEEKLARKKNSISYL